MDGCVYIHIEKMCTYFWLVNKILVEKIDKYVKSQIRKYSMRKNKSFVRIDL